MDVLVTGGAGFIGSNTVRGLLDEGFGVRVLDNMSTGRRENLDEILEKIEFVEGDLRDKEAVEKAVSGVDYIIHEGALPSVPRSIDDPILSNEVNLSGTLNVLWAAKTEGVRRVVFASSSSIYGDTPTLPKVETMTPTPLSPYAVSKLSCEHYMRVFTAAYGLETVCLRYFNVYGPRQDPASEYAAVVPKFATAYLSGKPPTIFGDGEQTRDFTYIKDVVSVNIAALTAPKASGEIVNIAGGKRVSVNELAQIIADITGSDAKPNYEPERPGDVKHSLADVRLARDVLDFKPKYGLKEGLTETVEYFKNQAD